MAVDFSSLFQQFYPPGPGRQYVSLTGTDSNNGTSASTPKRNISAAMDAMPSGGIVYVANGNYGQVSLTNRNYSANGWCLIMAQNYLGAKFQSAGDSRAFQLTRSSYVGLFGFEVQGIDQQGYENASCIWGGTGVHHISVWRCWAHHGIVGIGFPGNQGGGVANLNICYNIVNDCARWSSYASSGISIYNYWPPSSFPGSTGDDQYGFSNYIVGNICCNNYESTGPFSDGNGIIIDDGNNTQSYGGPTGQVYTGKTLLLGNLTIRNGGRGVHVFQTSYCEEYFNTSAHNNFNKGLDYFGELSQMFSNGGAITKYNLVKVDTASGRSNWFAQYAATVQSERNVIVAGSDPGTTSPIVRSSEGFNYFKNNAPTLLPNTIALADQWRPDGGSGQIEKVVIDQTLYNRISRWPDLFGDMRPDRTAGWAIGMSEATAGTTPPTGSAPVVSFTIDPVQPVVGQVIQLTDTSTNSPTAWAWELGGTGADLLTDPGRQEVAFQLLSSWENSSLNWRAQYQYIQDINDGRGYTGGIAGFCSGTGDMLMVVDRFIQLKPTNNPLQPYRAALVAVNGTASHAGLGTAYETAWANAAINEPLFRQAQDEIRKELYLNPAVLQAKADGLGVLGQFVYFDHSILNGFDGMMNGIRNPVIAAGTKPPSQGGNENTYLNAWLQRAIVQMDTDPAHSDHSRVIAQQKFRTEGKFGLELPLAWTAYGDSYSITTVTPAYGSGSTSTSRNPTTSFSVPGTYNIKLTATNQYGSASKTSSVTVVAASTPGGTIGTLAHPALGQPGHLMTSTNLGQANGGTCYRITYQMRAAPGNGGGIINASALAYIPTGTPPANGWRFLTVAHGVMNNQLHDEAAASLAGTADNFQNSCGPVNQWLALGFAVVQTDYEGVYAGGDSNHYPVYTSKSFTHSMLGAAKALAGLTTIRASGAAAGFSMGGPAALACGEWQKDLYPEIQQFCVVGFDPWIAKETTDGYYSQGYGDDTVTEYVYGLYLDNPALPLSTIVTGDAISKIQNLDSYYQPYGIRTPATGGNGVSMSYIANPTRAGNGWAAAATLNSPGNKKSVPCRVYSPTSGGLYGGDIWLNLALASGSPATRVVTQDVGHAVNTSYQNDARVWIPATLDAQSGATLPVAGFTISPSTAAPGATFTTTNTSSGATSYSWNWGDGTTSTTASPTHVYANAGTYTVTLTATNASGTSSYARTVTVSTSAPTGTSTYEAESGTPGVASGAQAGVVAPQIGSSNPGYQGTGYIGNFGDPGQTLQFSVSITQTGQHRLSFRYQKGDGAYFSNAIRDLYIDNVLVARLNFAATTQNDWAGNSWSLVTYDFNWTTTGTKLVRLQIPLDQALYANYADFDRLDVSPLTTATPPQANFTPNKTTANVGELVGFTSTSTGGPTLYAWDFGDGAVANGATLSTTSHAYGAAGTYAAKLTVSNDSGSTSKVVTITVQAVTTPPDPDPDPDAPLTSLSYYKWMVGPGAANEFLLNTVVARSMSFSRTEGATANFTIRGEDGWVGRIQELVTDLKVLRNDDLIFRGRIGPSTDKGDANSQTCEFTAFDYRKRLSARALRETDVLDYVSVDQGEIGWQFINTVQQRANGNEGITKGVYLTGVLKDISLEPGTDVEQAIQSVANATDGYDWEIDAQLKFNTFSPKRGRNRTSSVVMDFGGAFKTYTRSFAAEAYANVVWGTASGGLDPVWVESGDIASRSEGRWERTAAWPDIASQEAHQDNAEWLLQESVRRKYTYQIVLVPGHWRGRSHYWLGDTVQFRLKQGRLNINEDRVIETMDIVLDENGKETVTVTLS